MKLIVLFMLSTGFFGWLFISRVVPIQWFVAIPLVLAAMIAAVLSILAALYVLSYVSEKPG